MKKLFTLAAAGAMAATSFGAQAQVTVDGVLNANELTAGNYVLLGKFTNPHSFGDHDLLSLYAANTATKVYIFVAGTVETNTNAFQLFLGLPGGGGVPAGTALPAGTAGSYYNGLTVTMEMPTNLSIALRATDRGATTFRIEGANYTSATSVTSKQLTTTAAPLTGDGTALALPADAAFPELAGARVAYKNTNAAGDLAGPTASTPLNPGNTASNMAAGYGGVGSYGWEIELDRAALGALTGTNPALKVFVLQNGDTGNYISGDFIPQSTTALPGGAPTYGSIGNGNVDFATIPGVQSTTITLTANGVTLNAKTAQATAALRFGIYPNPGSALNVNYTVPQGKQDVSLSVFDVTGKQVRSLREAQAGAQSYKLSNLRAGIYVVKLNVGGQETSGKVVIE